MALNIIKSTFWIFFNAFILSAKISAQLPCLENTDAFTFKPSANNTKIINWQQFPEFSLPFKIVYGGPHISSDKSIPLKKGFSHISSTFENGFEKIPAQNRALLYYGVAYNFNTPQPWQLIRSPWANNMPEYYAKWSQDIDNYKTLFDDTKNSATAAADILMLDIERHWEGSFPLATNLAILAEKGNALVPLSYRQLTDNEYISIYIKDMLKLYAEPLNLLNSQGKLVGFNTVSSYGDVPIKYQSGNIEGNSWSNWQTKKDALSYLMKDSTSGNLGGQFYNQLNTLSPSCYIQSEYAANPKTQGGDYLAEALFQIEVNKAWSQKDIMPFVWLRYETDGTTSNTIKTYQAEAMAIFPFFSGAKGLWLWENNLYAEQFGNWNIYEYFINALYKLSKYKDFFIGNYSLHIPTPARDLYVNQLPVWRAVVKDDKILVAAQNPYASENETTKLEVSYKDWKNTITLTGREVILCSFNLVKITGNEPANNSDISIQILGNPIINNELDIEILSTIKTDAAILIYNSIGQNIYNEKTLVNKEKRLKIDFRDITKGVYYCVLSINNKKYIHKIIY